MLVFCYSMLVILWICCICIVMILHGYDVFTGEWAQYWVLWVCLWAVCVSLWLDMVSCVEPCTLGVWCTDFYDLFGGPAWVVAL